MFVHNFTRLQRNSVQIDCAIDWKQTTQRFPGKRLNCLPKHPQSGFLHQVSNAIQRLFQHGWFGVAVMAFVTSTKLSYIEPGLYWDWWRPLVGLLSQCLSRPLRPTQPGHPSVGRCNENRRWFRPSLGRNGTSEVMTLRCFINQLIKRRIKGQFLKTL